MGRCVLLSACKRPCGHPQAAPQQFPRPLLHIFPHHFKTRHHSPAPCTTHIFLSPSREQISPPSADPACALHLAVTPQNSCPEQKTLQLISHPKGVRVMCCLKLYPYIYLYIYVCMYIDCGGPRAQRMHMDQAPSAHQPLSAPITQTPCIQCRKKKGGKPLFPVNRSICVVTPPLKCSEGVRDSKTAKNPTGREFPRHRNGSVPLRRGSTSAPRSGHHATGPGSQNVRSPIPPLHPVALGRVCLPFPIPPRLAGGSDTFPGRWNRQPGRAWQHASLLPTGLT